MGISKMIRHLGDFINFSEEQLMTTLEMDVDPRTIKIMIENNGIPTIAGRVDFVRMDNGDGKVTLGLLLKPFLGEDGGVKETANASPGGEGA